MWVAPPDHPLVQLVKAFVPCEPGTSNGSPCVRIQHHILLSLLLAPGYISRDNLSSLSDAVADAGGITGFTIADGKANSIAEALVGALSAEDMLPENHPEFIRCLRSSCSSSDSRLHFTAHDVIVLRVGVTTVTPQRTAPSASSARRGLRSGRRGGRQLDDEQEEATASNDSSMDASSRQDHTSLAISFLGSVPLNDMVNEDDPLPLIPLAMLRLLLGPEYAADGSPAASYSASLELLHNHVCRMVQSTNPSVRTELCMGLHRLHAVRGDKIPHHCLGRRRYRRRLGGHRRRCGDHRSPGGPI